MDRIINSKVDKHSIYEIYRACRLCGAGAGYKMPIIQNVIDIDGEEIELKQKIRECVHIEVHQDDKMPPLICELCVDKVNDFYEFLDMCRQTNKRTRKRLGLPLHTTKKGSSDSGDCILGVTEPVYVNEDSNEPLVKSSPRNVKQTSSKVKKEVKVEPTRDSRSSRGGKPPQKRPRSPSPRTTRHSRTSNEDNQSLSSLKHQAKKTSKAPPPPPPKSILKKESKVNEKLSLRSKRTQEPPKAAVPQKKVKLSLRSPPKPERVKPPPPPPGVKCSICRHQSKTAQANGNHMRMHTVTFTSDKMACNSCREWFVTSEDAMSHHKRHKARGRPYTCRGCRKQFPTHHAYQSHAGTGCVPWEEVPDLQCSECWKYFPTENLLEQHKCPGVDGRPGGKCSKCNRSYATMKNLKKHESTCTPKKRGLSYIDPALLAKVRSMQIRVARCDPLFERTKGEHYDVSGVPEDYGLDLSCVYPYLHSSLNFNRMVNIKTELNDLYIEEDYIHWDSDISTDDEDTERERKILSLSTLALKTLFSNKCLGRVPRKKRKVKTEKSVFDSILDTDLDMSKDIDNIIDNLGFDDNDGADDNITKDVSEKESESQENVNNDENANGDVSLNDSSKSEEKASDLSKENEESSAETKNPESCSENDKVSTVETEKSDGVSDSNEKQDKASDEHVSENVNESSNQDNVNVSTDSEKPEVTSESKEELELSNENTSGNVNDSTNNDITENINDAKEISHNKDEVSTENNEKDIEQDSNVSKLSENVDSASELIVDKNSDTNVSESEDKIKVDEAINENIDQNAESSVKVSENSDDSGISKNIEHNHDDNNVKDLSNKDDEEVNSVQSSTEEKNNDDETHTEEKINNLESHTEELSERLTEDKENTKENIESTEESNNIESENATDRDQDNANNEQTSKNNDKMVTNASISDVTNDISDATNDISDVTHDKANDVENEEPKTIEENHQTETTYSDAKTNGDVDEKSDKLNMEDFKDVSDAEIDDKKLMDDLNEHIGETDEKPANKNDENERIEEKMIDSNVKNDDGKITLDDLIPKKDSDTRSMDLDSISDDEFNFDS